MEKWDGVVLDVNATYADLEAPFVHSWLKPMQSLAARHSVLSCRQGQYFNAENVDALQGKEKAMRIMALPPTDLNLFLHLKRAHLHMLLWKAADHLGLPEVSISEYGWELACNEANCSCHRVKLNCTIFCFAQPAMCAATHSPRKRTRRRTKNNYDHRLWVWQWSWWTRRWPAEWLKFNARIWMWSRKFI